MIHSAKDGLPYYIELVGNADYRKLFASTDNLSLLASLTETQACYRYASGKWSIKQILGHITDHERIMVYRALRFSRKDTTPLPGYDQDLMVNNARFDELTYQQLLNDQRNVRSATLSFIDSLSPSQFQLGGTASDYQLTVENALKGTIGHEMHHMNILKERYLKFEE